jgi:hypothetical protein
LKKTFAGSNEEDGNERDQRQQVAGAAKFKVFADVCRECTNNFDMLREELQSFPKCPNKQRPEKKGTRRKGAWQKRECDNEATNEQKTYGDLTEQDRQSIQSFTKSQRGVHLPQ